MKITFNGRDLSKYIRVLDAERNLLPTVDNTVTTVTGRSGAIYDWDRLDIREIAVKYVMIADDTVKLQKLKREFAGVVKTAEPQKLVFSDEPDVYYMAKLDSDTALTQTLGVAEGVLTFICVDPLAYSQDVKSVSTGIVADYTEPPENTVTVDYCGTAEASPVVSAKFSSECGYLALINQDGQAVQVGNPDEVDRVAYQRNETAIHDLFRTNTGKWAVNSALLPYPYRLFDPALPNRQSGSYDWTTSYDSIYPVFETVSNSEQTWGGPALSQTVPVNSEGSRTGNFQQRARFMFKQQKNNREMGRIEGIIQSGTDVMASFVLRDSSGQRQEYIFEIWILNELIEQIPLNVTDHPRGFFEAQISRMGDTLSFTISGIDKIVTEYEIAATKSVTRSYRLPEIAGKPVDKVHLWMAQYSNSPVIDMSWTDYKFIWVNVDKIQEIPNQFQPDDELIIDHATGRIFVNSVEMLGIGALGNDFFKLQSGSNSIHYAYSEWAESPPEITVTYREAFL